MLDHARDRPDESLGVIAMNIKHADRIDAALRRALAEHPELQEYFDETRTEPYFVKNLERVQGDERDAIILSIGYGKDATGRLPYRFGPLLREGGERRLNVAVTRARRRMTLVSAFSAADMDPGRSSAKGVRLLGEYLRYAELGGTDLGGAADRPELNPFEIDVRDRLTAAGIPLIAQYGVAGYHIDFAASHPQRPGELVLAIEADGASYHSSPTARDRDRLRQEHLERLGWTFHRIWSTDWFSDPDECVTRAVAAYQAAVVAADARHADGVRKRPTRSADSDEGPAAGRDGGSDVGAPPSGRARTLPRPGLIPGQPITAYRHQELVALIRWLESDTLLRTEEEILREVMRELGFRKRGSRIAAAVSAALRDARQSSSLRPQ
jgi:very-short-patch-repair endonuclease